jgi:hypothetical protein
MSWELRAGPDVHFATVLEVRDSEDLIANRSASFVIAELRNEGSVSQVLARGRLIAAAPELYNALESALEAMVGKVHPRHKIWLEAEKALVLARGGPQ